MHEGCVKKGTEKGSMLLVWDAEGTPPAGDWTTVLWRQYAASEDPSVISIARLVEQESDELRSRYLAWIYDLGEARVIGEKVLDHLVLRPGFSYWWMSSLAQKFNVSGVSLIDDAIKTLALEKLVVARQAASVVLISSNRLLAECLQGMCRTKRLDCECRLVKNIAPSSKIRSSYYSLPHSWQAFIYLARYVVKAIPLCMHKRPAIPGQAGKVMFIDVLVHLDKRARTKGCFISNYWTALIEKLAEWQIKSNWLHLYYRHPEVPSSIKAQHLIGRFNKFSEASQFHVLIERSLNLRVLGRAVRDYFRIRRSSAFLSGIDEIRPEGSDLNLWPMHVAEWRDSLCGKEAMRNCLWLALFEEALNRFPPQRIGVYIAENQPWEMALVYAWKAAGHGTLVGAPHTTIRFWDLRYHYDARSYSNGKDSGLPLPDILAVNGPAARAGVLASGYPEERVTEVEALRYLHLLGARPDNEVERSTGERMRILICGDFLAETNRRILAWLDIAARSLPDDAVYVFKPHPAFPLKPADYPVLKLEISQEPLVELLSECDVVFTSNITSAAVDAYCSGVPVIQMLDGKTFNVSPLRGLKDVVYVTNPLELAEALGKKRDRNRVMAESYFYLDKALPRWRKLLDAKAGDGQVTP
jgi:surface carbohydrate biosynthesis protein (TIGR04326 family)